MNFSNRLKLLRAEKNISQVKLAEIMNLSRRIIQTYEAGTQEPTLSKLIAFADLFDVSIDYLVGRTDNPEVNR